MNRYFTYLAAAIAIFILGLPGAANLQAFIVSGTVTNPNSISVEGVEVLMYTQEGDEIWQLSDTTDSNGYYSISDVWPEIFGISFKPSSDTYAPQFTTVAVEQSDITLNVILEYGNVLSGYVRDTLEVGILDVDLNVYDQFTGDKLYTPSDNTNDLGYYDVVVPAGTYRIRYRYRGEDQDARYVPIELENEIIIADTEIDVVLAEGYYIEGTVTGPGGVPVADADLDAENSETGEKIFTPGDNTDENGEYQFLVPPGTYDINVAPLPESHLLPAIEYGVPVFEDITNLNFILEAGFMLYGYVRDPDLGAVSDVDLDIWHSNNGEELFTPRDNTDESGFYQIILPQYGTFDVLYKPPVVSPYLAPILLQGIYLPEDMAVDVTAPYGYLLSGLIQNGSGIGVYGVDIDAEDASSGIDMPLVGDHTDSSGQFASVLVPGIYHLEIEPPIQRCLEARKLFDFALNENTSIVESLDTGMVVSGIVSNQYGSPMPDVKIIAIESYTLQEIFLPGNMTNLQGYYQILIHPDTYNLIFTTPDLLDSIVINNTEVSRDLTIDITFYNTAPEVTVIAPNGGENWPVFSEQTISWTAYDDVAVTSVDIFYSTNGLIGPFSLVSTGENNDGNFLWNVPAEPTEDAVIKIVAHDADFNVGIDISDSPFIISQESSGYHYIPGDVNMAFGLWPPSVIGGDVTYLVGYFTGGDQIPCNLGDFWASADINGDCQVIGGDVTSLVSYLTGIGSISYCPNYEPAWPPIPEEAPEGWPNCDSPVINSNVIPTGSVK